MVSADEERRDLASPSPKVSVIMPVHNTQDDYLRKAIASVLCQTLGDFELIIVDDGSDAYVRDCVMSFHDGRIVFHRFLHNLGVVAARNGRLITRVASMWPSWTRTTRRFRTGFTRNAGILTPTQGMVLSTATRGLSTIMARNCRSGFSRRSQRTLSGACSSRATASACRQLWQGVPSSRTAGPGSRKSTL